MKPLAAALAAGVVILAAGWGLAAVYTWKDEHGVVHMTDRDPAAPGRDVEVTGPQAKPGPQDRGQAVRTMLAKAQADPAYPQLQRIVAEFRQSHTYSALDYFVCVDMALDLCNILKTKGFSPKVAAGSIKTDIAGLPRDKLPGVMDHAWVVVELKPGINLALEATGGFVVDGKVANFEYYYQGLVFDNPRQAKETDALIHNAIDNCKTAQDLITDWNANYAGRPANPAIMEAKGRLDAKMAECRDYNARYQDLINKQYRTLY